jgi:hypothetical protein
MSKVLSFVKRIDTGAAMIAPTQYEKSEWSRLAQWAYARTWNDLGYAYSIAASLPHDSAMSIYRFDRLQALYRKWLLDGLSHFEADQFLARTTEHVPRSTK